MSDTEKQKKAKEELAAKKRAEESSYREKRAPSKYKGEFLSPGTVPKSESDKKAAELAREVSIRKGYKNIPEGSNIEGINKFHDILVSKNLVGLPETQTREGYNRLIKPELEKFNLENPSIAITPDNILKLQEFHSSKNPDKIIYKDSTYGPQTTQFYYEPIVATQESYTSGIKGAKIEPAHGMKGYELVKVPEQGGAGYAGAKDYYINKSTGNIFDPVSMKDTDVNWFNKKKELSAQGQAVSNVITPHTTGDIENADIIKTDPTKVSITNIGAGFDAGLDKNLQRSKEVTDVTIPSSNFEDYKKKAKGGIIGQFKKGGLVKKVKGYNGGGSTGSSSTQDNSAEVTQAVAAGLPFVNELGQMAIKNQNTTDEAGRIDTGSKAGDYATGIGSGVLGGATKGAAMGSSFGPYGMIVGAAGGALVGGVKGGIETKRDREAIASEKMAEEIAKRQEAQMQQNNAFANNLSNQMQSRKTGYGYNKGGLVSKYAKGGYVKGPGTGTSDDVEAKVEKGSFIVPAKNAHVAEKIDNMMSGGNVKKAPSKKKVASLNEEDGEEVRLSNGEYKFTPEQRDEIIRELGEDVLEMLAPEAEEYKEGETEEKSKGGLTSMKAKEILKDGTVHGKALTDKQKRYMGWIAGGGKPGMYKGGEVDKYAPGGKIGDNEVDKIKQLSEKEKELKLKEEQDLVKQKKDAELRNMKASLYKSIIGNNYKRGNVQKQLTDQIIKLDREYKAKKDAYDTYVKQQDSLKNRKNDYLGSQNKLYNEKNRLAKEKELLMAMQKNKEELENTSKMYKFFNDNANFNPDGSIKKSSEKSVNAIVSKSNNVNKTNKEDSIPSMGGADAEKKLEAQNVMEKPSEYKNKTGVSSKRAPMKNKPIIKETAENLPNKPLTSNTSEPQLKKSTMPEYTEGEKAAKEELANRSNAGGKGLTGRDWAKVAGDLADVGSAAANFMLPRRQVNIGKKFLAEAGSRPVDTIQPEVINAYNKAQQEAKFGFTPQERALINQRDLNALNKGVESARLYGGGGAGSYAMTREAINQSYGRGLQSAIANNERRLQKQAFADQLGMQKAEMSRRLYEDQMNAWQQKQQAGSELVSAGLTNAIQAKRYADVLRGIQKAKGLENVDYSNINIG